MAELIGLTGKSGAGKTKVCQDIIQAAIRAGLSVFGFYCPAVFAEKEKTGIEVCLLPGGGTYLLGSLENRENWLPIGRWWMDPSVFDLVNEHLKKFVRSDLLLIDEVGPAEIEGNKGWPVAMNLLKEGHFQIGVVSFRPAYIEFFKEKYPTMKVLNLDEGGQAEVQNVIARFCKPNLPG